MSSSVIEGLILSILADHGPTPIFNLSPLEELITHKLSIAGITILSMGLITSDSAKERSYNLLGPIPVPDSPIFLALCVFFNVRPDLGTKDPRVEKHGRESNIWLIFRKENRDEIFNNFDKLEEVANEVLKPFKKESELHNELEFREILTKFQQIYSGSTSEKSNLEINTNQHYSNKQKLNMENIITNESMDHGFYTIDQEDNTISVRNINKLLDLECIIQIALKEQIIYVIQNKKTINPRRMFILGRAASQINLTTLKSKFQIKKLVDEVEVNFHMKYQLN